MGIFSGSTEVQSVFSGSTAVQSVYSGSTLVWRRALLKSNLVAGQSQSIIGYRRSSFGSASPVLLSNGSGIEMRETTRITTGGNSFFDIILEGPSSAPPANTITEIILNGTLISSGIVSSQAVGFTRVYEFTLSGTRSDLVPASGQAFTLELR